MSGVDQQAGQASHRDEEGSFNLSAWALRHQSLVVFLISLVTLFGVLSYSRLAQSEDPPFTFRVMVIRTLWPGATAQQVQEQVTDRIGKLQETPATDFLRSYSRPGESLIFFTMKDSAPASKVPEEWYQIRKKVGDIAATLPQGVQGPFFNDEFGDVYTNIYALEGDGFRPPNCATTPMRCAPCCCAYPAWPRWTTSAISPNASTGNLQHPADPARHLAAAAGRGHQQPERGHARRHADHRGRPHLRAPQRPVRRRPRAGRHADPRQRQVDPPGRYRRDPPRLPDPPVDQMRWPASRCWASASPCSPAGRGAPGPRAGRQIWRADRPVARRPDADRSLQHAARGIALGG